MLTGKMIAICRDLLAEHRAKQVESSRGTASGRGEIQRYWAGIPEPWHDAVLEFLANYVSAYNYEVVRIEGDPSVPGVLGDYVFTHEVANGRPVRSNGEFYLKAVHYEEASGEWLWAIVDRQNFILYLTEAISTDPIVHWADDWDEWKDEWNFADEQGVLEPPAAQPEVPDTAFTGQVLSMSSAQDHIRVNEYGWVVNDDEATYTVTGDITLTAVAAQSAVYGVVKAPLVDGHVRSGIWSAGNVQLVKTEGKRSANEGGWVVQQTLWQEPSAYLLIGKKVTARETQETRLYTGVAEARVSERVAELAVLGGYAVSDVTARQAQDQGGIYNVMLTVTTLTAGAGYLVVGREVASGSTEETRLYYNVAEADVESRLAALAALEGYAVVNATARPTKYDGVFDVYATLLSVNDGGSYLVVGRQETAYTTEETRLYERVAQSALTALIDSITVLGGYSLVASSAARTKWDGVFDVRLTLRTVTGAAGDVQIGGTQGLFATKLFLRERVARADLAAALAALEADTLVRSIRTTKTREEGFHDLFYTRLVVPAARVERKISYDRREVGWTTANAYNTADAYEKYIASFDGENNPVYAYLSYKKRLPSAYLTYNANQSREVAVVQTISYSESDPGAPSGSFVTDTATGGSTTRLPNGLWENRVVVITYPWWN